MRSTCSNRSEKKKGDKMEEFTPDSHCPVPVPRRKKRVSMAGTREKKRANEREGIWDRIVAFHTLSDNSDFGMQRTISRHVPPSIGFRCRPWSTTSSKGPDDRARPCVGYPMGHGSSARGSP